MCKSIADGGLRCEAHLNNDIVSLKNKYNEGLNKEAEKANIPFNKETIETAEKAYQEEMNALKANLLVAHEAALSAKNGGPDAAFTPAPFSSIATDLSSIKDKVKARFNRLVSIADGGPTDSDILDRPELATFAYKQEYIDAIHLLKHYDEKMDEIYEDFKTSPNNDGRRKITEHPEYAEKLKSLREQEKAVERYIQPLRSKYMENKEQLQKTGVIYGGKDVAVIEYQVSMTPPTGSFKKLDYQIKVKNFKRLKSEYEEKAKRGFDTVSATKDYAKANKLPLYDMDALKTFKSEVYDKSDTVANIQSVLQVKNNQLKLSSGYRKKIGREAEAKQTSGDFVGAKALFKQKEELDYLAEMEMAKNRGIARKRGLNPQF